MIRARSYVSALPDYRTAGVDDYGTDPGVRMWALVAGELDSSFHGMHEYQASQALTQLGRASIDLER